MHALTKILIVLAFFLTLPLTGLVVAYTSNADKLVAANERLSIEKRQLESAIGGDQAQHGQVLASKEAEIANINALLTEAQGRLASLERENENLRVELNQQRRASLTHSAQIDQFNASVQMYAELNRAQSDELGALRQRELEKTRREIELTDRINDLDGELIVSRETIRALQEQIADLRETVAGGPAIDGLSPASVQVARAPANFQAEVTSVDRDADGRTILIEFRAGSSDGLAGGMELNIGRGATYVGKAVILRVGQNVSVARFVDMGVGERPQAGDVVRGSTL